jgi:hypothetical protein
MFADGLGCGGLRNGFCCGKMRAMPVTTRTRLSALVEDLGSQAKVAKVLEVDRSRVSRWLKSEDPDAENTQKVEGIEFVLARLLRLYDRETAIDWLSGFNAHLGGRRLIDMISRGRLPEVIAAVDADELGTFA